MSNAIDELSRRGQGKTNDEAIQKVPAEFAGNFHLRQMLLTFSRLLFVVPGVAANMKGSYGIQSQALAFAGDVQLEATMSQAIGGKKG